jgi:hypothetical protein
MLKLTIVLGSATLMGVLTACGALVSFPNAKLSEGDTTRTISGLLAKPEGNGPFPAVVLLHTCGGLRPHVYTDWTNYLTAFGYVTLSVDSFGPRGITRCPTPLVRDRRELSRDAYGALEYLASLPFIDKERVGVMGFSLGGNTIDYFAGQNLKTPTGLNFKAPSVFTVIVVTYRDTSRLFQLLSSSAILKTRDAWRLARFWQRSRHHRSRSMCFRAPITASTRTT